MTDQSNESHSLFQSNKLHFFNNGNDQSKQMRDWYHFDKIILRKIQDIHSNAIYLNEGERNGRTIRQKHKPSLIRFQNSLLNSFRDKKTIENTYEKDNISRINNHYKMIPSHSLPYINYNNRNKSKATKIDHSVLSNNNSRSKSKSFSKYSTNDCNRRDMPNLNEYIISNIKIRENRVIGDIPLKMLNKAQNLLNKDNDTTYRSIDNLSKLGFNDYRYRNMGSQLNQMYPIPKGVNYPLKRIKLIKNKELEEQYNVSNCDYTILSNKNPDLFKTLIKFDKE